jgi:GT2 family glycosyltransferase
VVEVELTRSIADHVGLQRYLALQALVRWHGAPLGWVRVPVKNGVVTAHALRQHILEQLQWPLVQQVLQEAIRARRVGEALPSLLRQAVAPAPTSLPTVTVAVCTRDRPTDLARCLEAIDKLTLPVEVLVVDNAPSTDATEVFVRARPEGAKPVRYVREPRPGLDWARNRAILEATGDIIAFTDDDAVVDASWTTALARVFAENPQVMAVTGLVIPDELETDAQVLFELNGGFGRGFERRWLHFPQGRGMSWGDLGTGNLGTGANMAFRRRVFGEIGAFDPALDVGTPTQGAGDLEMFFRALKEGYALVYEPRAIVRHRHRRDYAQLRRQLQNNGSVYAAFLRSTLAYPDTRLRFARLGASWLWRTHIRPLLTSYFYPSQFPRDLRIAQLWGCLKGRSTYAASRKQASLIAAKWPDEPVLPGGEVHPARTAPDTPLNEGIAVRRLELTDIAPLTDVDDVTKVRIFVTWQGTLLGFVDIANAFQPVSTMRLSQEIAQHLGQKLVCLDRGDAADRRQQNLCWLEVAGAIDDFIRGAPAGRPRPSNTSDPARLPAHVSVSIVVGTYDRPADLRNCLRGLTTQSSLRPREIIVVDNHPSSGRTPPIVAEFPTVKLVDEPRQGASYARNAGIVASKGEIIVTVDDDVTVPNDWLERLLAPFSRPDVLAVTGNVLPLELDTRAQQLFEMYGNGGLGRGYYRIEVGREWFERSWRHAVPTWELGGTANSAYRASVFADPKIGLMNEALGPGMPSGVGEDIYLFYKILKAGGTVCYEATAYVWHNHRREFSALKRQLYGYSKGFTSYHLTTLMNDGDWRALTTLLLYLPIYRLRQLWRFCKGERYPLSLILLEIGGNLAGLWSLWRSRRIVRHEGRSGPYVRRPWSDDVPVETRVAAQ